MPRGDGTGPMGMGSMTGRAAGWCSGFGMPGYSNPVSGRGFGMGFGSGRGFFGGRGGGRGRRNWLRFEGYDEPYVNRPAFNRLDPNIEKQDLRRQADALQTQLDFIRKRLDEIEKDNKVN
jgi:hypothetical protein